LIYFTFLTKEDISSYVNSIGWRSFSNTFKRFAFPLEQLTLEQKPRESGFKWSNNRGHLSKQCDPLQSFVLLSQPLPLKVLEPKSYQTDSNLLPYVPRCLRSRVTRLGEFSTFRQLFKIKKPNYLAPIIYKNSSALHNMTK
jgi:hypothetical protein